MRSSMDNHCDRLRERLSGEVVVPGDLEYDTARRVWNADIDRKPAALARVAGAEDIVACLAFARERGLEVSVRGGAHSFAGTAVCDGGLVIDLRSLRTVTVDPVARTARAGGGALNADLDAATQQFGLAAPTGTVSDTGIGGITLGGGFGWLTAKHGLVVDNLLSAQVVLADGRVVRASVDSHPDLFWALRGGGGNFGIVTEFEFQLHPVGPLVHLGTFFWDIGRSADALRLVGDLVSELPAGMGVMVGGMSAPPADFVPAEHRGRLGYCLMLHGSGTAEEHAEVAAKVRDLAPPSFELVTTLPYVELQKMLDAASPPGMFNYIKGLYVDDLPDELINILVAELSGKVSPLSGVQIIRLDGEYCAVAEDATAFGGSRRPSYMVSFAAICTTAEQLAVDRIWARSCWRKVLPFASNVGGYINMVADYEEHRVRASYGAAKYDRLARIKAVYDPSNVFRHNGNITPTAPGTDEPGPGPWRV